MALALTRRGLLAGGTVLGALHGGKPASAQDVADPQVEMRPLSAIVSAKPPTALPAATFHTLDGAPVSLSSYAGRIVVLNFWATWCVPCVAELPELDRLAAAGGLAVLAVSADRAGAAAVRPFAASHHIAHATLLLDQGSEAVHALNVAGFPTTLIIGPDGKLRGTLEGPAAWSGAGPAIRALAAEPALQTGSQLPISHRSGCRKGPVARLAHLEEA